MDYAATLEFVKDLLMAAWAYDGVKLIVSHTLVNLCFAVAAALKLGEFKFAKIGEFLINKMLPYTMVYFVVKVFGDAAGVAPLAPVALAAIEATLAGDLADNLGKLGLPIPEFARK